MGRGRCAAEGRNEHRSPCEASNGPPSGDGGRHRLGDGHPDVRAPSGFPIREKFFCAGLNVGWGSDGTHAAGRSGTGTGAGRRWGRRGEVVPGGFEHLACHVRAGDLDELAFVVGAARGER